MDTSKEYIKMCERAVEIQGQSSCDMGTFYYIPSTETFMVHGMLTNIKTAIHGKPVPREAIFIPRQDQLQEMVVGGWLEVLDKFWEYCSDSDGWENSTWFASYRLEVFTSMEQLWLAFVMKEKFGKVWDGEEWKSV